MPAVGNQSNHPCKSATEIAGSSSWGSSRYRANEGDCQKLYVVEWTRQGCWRPSQSLLTMSRTKVKSSSCTSSHLAMANNSMEKNSYRFCRPLSGKDVPNRGWRPFQVARSYHDVNYYFDQNHRSTSNNICEIWSTGTVSIWQWTTIYISRIRAICTTEWNQAHSKCTIPPIN